MNTDDTQEPNSATAPAKPRPSIGELSAWVRWIPVIVILVAYLYCIFFEYKVISWGTCYDDGLNATAHLLYRTMASVALMVITLFLLLVNLAVAWWAHRPAGGVLVVLGLIVLALAWKIPRDDVKNELTQFAEGFRDRVQKNVDYHAIQTWMQDQKYKPGQVIPVADLPPAFDKIDSLHRAGITTDPNQAHTMIIKWHDGLESWSLIIGPSEIAPTPPKSPIEIQKQIEPGVYVTTQIG